MNDSPNRWRAIATFTILASALLFALAGCSNKTSPAPTAQTPPAAPGANPATAANSAPGNPANAANPAPAKPAPADPRDRAESTDLDLVQSYLDGDSAAFEIVFQRYHGQLRGACFRTMGDEASADDAASRIEFGNCSNIATVSTE